MGAKRRARRAEGRPRRAAPTGTTPSSTAEGTDAHPSAELLRTAGNRATGHVLRTTDRAGASTSAAAAPPARVAAPSTPEILQRTTVQRRGPDDGEFTGNLAVGIVVALLAWLGGVSLGRAAVEGLVAMGVDDEDDLTNLVFWARHPEASMRKLQPEEADLIADWKRIRRDIVRPVLKKAEEPSGGGSKPGSGGGTGPGPTPGPTPTPTPTPTPGGGGGSTGTPKPTKSQLGDASRVIPSKDDRDLVASKPDYAPDKAASEEDIRALVGAKGMKRLTSLLKANAAGTLTIDKVRAITNTTLSPDELTALEKALDARWDVGTKIAELQTATVKIAMERDIMKATGTSPGSDPAAAGKAAVHQWFAEISRTTFLGVRTKPLHREMRERLDIAAAALKSRLGEADDAAAGRKLGIRTMNGLRKPKPATGGTSPSLHCYGLATDINAGANPFVRSAASNAATRNAMLLVHQRVDKGVLRSPDKDAGKQWERLHEQSEALRTYLSLGQPGKAATLDGLAAAVRDAGLDTRSAAQWKAQIAADHKAVKKAGDLSQDPAKGLMDLQKALVEELTNAGLSWGGQYGRGKDVMHFDFRGGSLKRLDAGD